MSLTVDKIYETFLNCEDGKTAWKTAYSIYPEHNTDEADEAADYIYDQFSNWAYDNEDQFENNVDTWLEKNGDEMYEAIYAGLT